MTDNTFEPKIIAFLGDVPYDTQAGTLGKRIVACRRTIGLTQKELAWRLGVDPTALGGWKKGRGQPPHTPHQYRG